MEKINIEEFNHKSFHTSVMEQSDDTKAFISSPNIAIL